MQTGAYGAPDIGRLFMRCIIGIEMNIISSIILKIKPYLFMNPLVICLGHIGKRNLYYLIRTRKGFEIFARLSGGYAEMSRGSEIGAPAV
jgi:hypothetical protein